MTEMTAKMWQGLVFISVFVSVLSVPRHSRDASSENCIAKSTIVLTRALLQSYADTEKNVVFSPLGYSSLLAMLAEGSNGETEREMAEILHLHKENEKQRETFKEILSSIRGKYSINKPQLRTWFYVYRNFSVEESYKNVLSEYYLTEVKNVYPEEFEAVSQTKDIIAENAKLEEDADNFALPEDSGNSAYLEKQIIKKAEIQDELFKSGDLVQDEGVKDPIITHEQSNVASVEAKEEQAEVKGEATTINENPSEIQEDKAQANVNNNQPSENNLSKERTVNEAINLLHEKTRLGIDPTNILPDALKKGRRSTLAREALMIIFNGYYFETNWEVPFDYNVTSYDFHLNETAKVNASSIKTRGVFKVAELTDLNSTAISIPFQGSSYSLLIIMPNKCDDLSQLISDFDDNTIEQVREQLEEREVEVQIPKLNLESTTDPESAFNEIGLTSLYSEEADLSGISLAGGLYSPDIVQLATLKVSEYAASVNYMTATSVAGRSIKDKFTVDHPFLLFIEDSNSKAIIVAGKVINPTVTPL